MGSIFPVKRRSDQKLMIGKMMLPNEDFPREMIHNEIGVMMVNEGKTIIQVYDSLEYTPKPSQKEPNPKT
jgi:hypothetical protein